MAVGKRYSMGILWAQRRIIVCCIVVPMKNTVLEC